jgi:outer membrane receptor protein involved in Fe transport
MLALPNVGIGDARRIAVCRCFFFEENAVKMLSRILTACVIACLAAGPVNVAAAQPVIPSLVAQNVTTGAVAGSVSDESGAPIAGASVALNGPAHYHTTTDGKGAFTFAGVTPGIYTIAVTKAGYESANQNDLAVVPGGTEHVAVRISLRTFTSLRTIASVRVNGRGTINTSPASVNVVTTQDFQDQSQQQVTRVLSQIPGVQISFPSNSANAAAPGAITVPNIRDAESYETASLIDGHPISVGQYGDNVTTFLNAYMLGSVETIKGPGADSPVINNAVGGTVNFRTKDPTLTATPTVTAGIDSHGGTFSNFGISDTLGRLGFVVDIATLNEASPLNGKSVYYDPGAAFNSFTYNGATFNDNASSTPVGNTASNLNTQYPLVACCYTLLGNLDQTAELLKFRYKFSSATTATVSYLGSQSTSDQNANTSDFIPSQFVPGAGYSGALPAGGLNVSNISPGSYSGEFNNEPIFQAEVSTTLGPDAVLARFYHATISRYQYQGTSALSNDFQNVTLYGTTTDTNGNPYTFNGQRASVGFPDFYQEPELDRLSGETVEYQHPFGQDTVSVTADRTYAQTSDYSVFAGPFYSFNLPPGTDQTLTTYSLRGHFFLGKKTEATVADYLNTFTGSFPNGCPAGCNTYAAAVLGQGVNFASLSYAHNDPRLGLVFRPNPNAAVRFALGSGIVPPFSGLLNAVPSNPQVDASNLFALQTANNGGIRPETSFGYDLGGDVRLHGSTTLSGDIYLTNLYNRFFSQTVATGEVCSTATPCIGSGGGSVTTGNIPIFSQTNANISNARFEGIEATLKHEPQYGLGYQVEGSLQRGYFYNLPPNFYCSTPGPCTPANYDQNLNIIAGQNTNGLPVGFYNISYNGNMRIPYFQGNAEISYTFKNDAYLLFGETVYGKNNSLNEPAFGLAYATLRYPVTKALALQVSGDNIFNAYPGYLPILGGGVAIPLANGQTAATTGNVLGPATYRFSLTYGLP